MTKVLVLLMMVMSLNLMAAPSKGENWQQNKALRVEMVNKIHDMRRDFGEESRKKHLAFIENGKERGDHKAFKKEMQERRRAFKAEVKKVRASYKEKMKANKNKAKT